jgi:hypothetical protein
LKRIDARKPFRMSNHTIGLLQGGNVASSIGESQLLQLAELRRKHNFNVDARIGGLSVDCRRFRRGFGRSRVLGRDSRVFSRRVFAAIASRVSRRSPR